MIRLHETNNRTSKRELGTGKRAAALRFLCLLSLCLTVALSCRAPGEGKIAYVGGTLWDGTGAPPVIDAVIVVSGHVIESAGPPDAVEVPGGAEVIRADGKWIIPGLIDAHAHTERWMLMRFLAYGVTTVRDAGGNQDSILALRDEIDLGETLGPRLYIAGAVINGTPATAEGATEVRTREQARRAIDDRVLIEASHAKIYSQLDSRLFRALMEEANSMKIPVAAHLGKVDAITAARAGVRSIEHMTGVVEATASNRQQLRRAHSDYFTGWKMSTRAWAGLDRAQLESTAQSLAETGVAIVPTLVRYETSARLSDRTYVDQLDLTGVPSEVRDAWDIPDLRRRAGITAADLVAFRRSRPKQDLFVKSFREATGLVAAGTDTPNHLLAPGASLHDELSLLVRAGFTPREALLMATRDAARLLDTDAVGTVSDGKLADFVVLSADPLDDITNTRNIDFIVAGGTRIFVEDLRSEW